MNTSSWTKIATNAVSALILLALLGTIGVIGALRIICSYDIALRHAFEYAKFFKNATTVTCDKYDKDADGRVDCVVFRDDGSYVKINCDGWTVFLEEGCSLR